MVRLQFFLVASLPLISRGVSTPWLVRELASSAYGKVTSQARYPSHKTYRSFPLAAIVDMSARFHSFLLITLISLFLPQEDTYGFRPPHGVITAQDLAPSGHHGQPPQVVEHPAPRDQGCCQ